MTARTAPRDVHVHTRLSSDATTTRRRTRVIHALTLAVLIASAFSVTQAGTSCRSNCEALDAPVLINPGAQSDSLTSEYGYMAAVLSSNPIGYWRLEDFAGTTIKDSSASPHDGVAAGQITRAQAGALADSSIAVRFPGVAGTLIDVADEPFRLTNAVTVEAWVKADGIENAGSLFEKSVGGPLSYRLAQEAGFWTWKISGTFGDLQRWTPVTSEDVGAWVHLVGTFDGTATKLYKNGVLVHSHDAVGTLTTGSGISRMGGLANEGYPLAGGLDEVAVYGGALSAGHVAYHYALRASVPTVSLQLSASDSDSDPLVYTATGLPPGLQIHPVSGLISGNPTAVGTYSVTATATDPGQLASNQTFSWTIASPASVNPNRPVMTNPGSQSTSVTQEYGYAGAVLMANPVGYWRLEDYDGASVEDWSGHGHAGAAAGGIVRAIAGPLSDGSLAMQFDGESTTRIEIADDAAFRLTGAVTVEAWVKTTQAYGTGVVFDKTQGGITAASYRLMQEGDTWVWRVVGSFGTLNRWTPVTTSDVGAWVHLVGTFDGSTTRLYKNGVLMQSLEAIGTLTASAGSTRIGLLGYDAYPFPGSLDEIAVYGTALSAAQIASHYALRTTASTVSLAITASDPDSDPLTYSATGLPQGLIINPITGVISGNPTVSGSCDVTVTVRDPGDLAASQTFTWTVTTTVATNPHRPVLANPGNQTSPITSNYGYPSGVLTATPVGYWRLDDGSGSTAADRATAPHAGTIHGGVTLGQTGALADGSLAMRFDGVTGSRVEIPATSALELTNAVSVSLWAKADQQSAYGGLFDKTIGGATDQSYEILQEADRWSWWLWGTFGVVNVWAPVDVEDVGAWVHLVATFDGTTSRLYKNGVLVASAAAEGTLTGGEGVAQIGHLGSNIFAFAGSIDEAAVYGSALSATAIGDHYTRRAATAAVTLQLSASDPDSDPLLYTATGLPSTLILNPSTGLISGNPTAAGSFNVTATVRDPGGLAASRSFTWTFAPPSVSVALTSPFPGTTFRQPVDLTVAATATATNATITRVEFFAGQTSLGTDSTAPYEVSWTSVPIGSYSITAVATNSSGGTTTSAPVAISVIQSGSGSGTLGKPIATPAPGAYGPPLNVTLQAAPGATIRYTTDGNTPSTSSTAYSGPIAITQNTHLIARAFQSGWTTSQSFDGFYRLDTSPPTVRVIVAPAPNAAGWNNTDVEVRFDCQDGNGVGVSSCPSPVTLTSEGAGQVVSRTVEDRAGNEVTASATINIDKTDPDLTFTTSIPQESATSSITIGATVSDAVSGAVAASCNGSDASLSIGSLSCALALEPGTNLVLVTATDLAGNTASASARTRYGTETEPAPDSLRLSPSRITLVVGGARLLTLHDNFGRSDFAVTWTSSDETVATVTDGRVVAVGAGSASVVATHGELTSSTEVVVLGGVTTVPYGTVNWQTTTPGHTIVSLVTGSSETMYGGATYYTLTAPESGVGSGMQALTDDGDILWTAPLPIAGAYSAIGNSLGGVLISTPRAIAGVSAGGKESWRRDFQGDAAILGQSSDGTVFVSEYVEEGDSKETWVTLLDSSNGRRKARVPLARSSRASHGVCPEFPDPYERVWTGGMDGSFAIDANGTAYFFVKSSTEASYGCPGSWIFGEYHGSDSGSWSKSLELWTLSSNGQRTVVPVGEVSGSWVGGQSSPPASSLAGGTILPKDNGVGAVVTWYELRPVAVGEEYEYESRTYISAFPALGGTEISGALSAAAMGEEDTMFMTTNDGLVKAMSVSGFATRWTAPASQVVGATEEGGVAVVDDGVLKILDNQGALLASGSVAPGGSPGDGETWMHVDGASVVQSVAPAVVWAASDFVMAQGSLLGGSAPSTCIPEKFAGRANFDVRDYQFWVDDHGASSPAQFTPDQHAALEVAGERWMTSKNSEAQFPGKIEPGTQQSHNTVIQWHSVDRETHGYTSLPLQPVNFYSYDVDGANERKFGRGIYGVTVPSTMFGITVNYNDNLSIFLTEPQGPFLPGFAPAPGFGMRFFTFMALHEFGHMIGLKHPNINCSVQKTVMARGGKSWNATERPSWKGSDRFKMWPTDKDNEAVRRIYR